MGCGVRVRLLVRRTRVGCSKSSPDSTDMLDIVLGNYGCGSSCVCVRDGEKDMQRETNESNKYGKGQG